jgi:hypothetical protein
MDEKCSQCNTKIFLKIQNSPIVLKNSGNGKWRAFKENLE